MTATVSSWASSEFSPPRSPPPEPSMTSHGMEYPALFGQVVSAHPGVPLPGFWWKLTLSWPNPGHSVLRPKAPLYPLSSPSLTLMLRKLLFILFFPTPRQCFALSQTSFPRAANPPAPGYLRPTTPSVMTICSSRNLKAIEQWDCKVHCADMVGVFGKGRWQPLLSQVLSLYK